MNRYLLCRTRLAVAFFCAAAVCVSAQSPSSSARVDAFLSSLHHSHSISVVAVSPDGKRLTWTQDGELRLAPLNDLARSQRVVASSSQHCHEGDPFWAPDSASLGFLASCTAGQTEIYLDRLDGKTPRALSRLHGEVDNPAFAPDGKSVAFLYVPNATRHVGALAAMKMPAGVIGEDGIEVQHIATVPVTETDAEPKLITPTTLHVYEFDWSPDSKSLAYIAANPPGENNWWVAKLFTQPLAGEPKAILAPAEVAGPLHGLQIALPRWSPDGQSIAVIGGLMSDQGSTGGDIWLEPAAGGTPLNLTPGRASTPVWLEWASPRQIYATEQAAGAARLIRLDLPSALPTAAVPATVVSSFPGSLGNGRDSMGLAAPADHSFFLFRGSNYERAPEIFSFDAKAAGAEPKALTHLNQDQKPVWGKSVSLDWTNEGFHVQGWLLLPKDYDPAKKYPMIVLVHGGPAAAAQASWGGGAGLSATAFSALDYFVLQPNDRGSFGQGEAFTQANRKDFGYGDLRDMLAGVDAVLARYPAVDPKRVGLTGWSYGGFSTMFGVTQTTRFRAAVAGAGIANWQSYYGENSIDQWMLPYFGASVYDDAAVYAKSSAMTYIKQVKTPTLVVVGDRDGECPAPQSFEFWHALRAQGVATQLVVYPNEGHGFVDAGHRRDVLVRALDWFDRQMPVSH
jgi:dipeptidyl aminopeptidase/acylaminoacyl peptidase